MSSNVPKVDGAPRGGQDHPDLLGSIEGPESSTIPSLSLQPAANHHTTGTQPENLQLDQLSMEEPSQRSDDTNRKPDTEIHTIISQFDEEPDETEDGQLKTSESNPIKHPPRHSSLIQVEPDSELAKLQGRARAEPRETDGDSIHDHQLEMDRSTFGSHLQETPSRTHSIRDSIASLPAGPPPKPDVEELPFDFHRFLDQLRHRTADPVAKYLRSFLTEFGKKQWAVHEQVKLIHDFLDFITLKMARCEVWQSVSEPEFDNAREGMEKLVMNRLYLQTFSPAIPPPLPPPDSGRRTGAGRKKDQQQQKPSSSNTPGRRGQHQEDVERDEVLAQKVSIYGWVQESHLDMPPISASGRQFLNLAERELVKIGSYRAPRDKVICVLNCCKVIFGLLRNSRSDLSADSFVPLLIYVVLHARLEHLVSNVQYILRFRNQGRLGGEAGYYLSSLMGAIQFIETIGRSSITVSDEEFERNVESAVAAIAERHEKPHSPPATAPLPSEKSLLSPADADADADANPQPSSSSSSTAALSEKPRRAHSQRDRRKQNASLDGSDDQGLPSFLRSIQKPLSTIGRIFNDSDGGSTGRNSHPPITPARSPSRSTPPPPAAPAAPAGPSEFPGRAAGSLRNLIPGSAAATGAKPAAGTAGVPTGPEAAEDAAARQASAEMAVADQVRAQEHEGVVRALAELFPQLDQEVIDDVVRVHEGRVGRAVDACLALSAG